MIHNNGKNIINFDAVRAHKREDKELDFMPQTNDRNTRRTVNNSQTRSSNTQKLNNKSKGKQNVRNSYNSSKKQYKSSLKKNYVKVSKLVAAGMLSASMLLGGVAGYNISNANTGNVEYTLDEYNPTDLFNATNDLIQNVAEDTYFNAHPDDEASFNRYSLESYNEVSVAGNVKVTLKLNYSRLDSSSTNGVDSKSIDVNLPQDFGKNVYLPYKELRETSSRATKTEKEKMSYWLNINSDITDLTNGLERYIENTRDKEYAKSAQTTLDDSRINMDEDGER